MRIGVMPRRGSAWKCPIRQRTVVPTAESSKNGNSFRFLLHIFPSILALGLGPEFFGRVRMVPIPLDEEAIFKIAARIPSQEARFEYLQQVCAEDQALVERVLTLLLAHEESPSFLESPLPGFAATEVRAISEQAGDIIGP